MAGLKLCKKCARTHYARAICLTMLHTCSHTHAHTKHTPTYTHTTHSLTFAPIPTLSHCFSQVTLRSHHAHTTVRCVIGTYYIDCVRVCLRLCCTCLSPHSNFHSHLLASLFPLVSSLF